MSLRTREAVCVNQAPMDPIAHWLSWTLSRLRRYGDPVEDRELLLLHARCSSLMVTLIGRRQRCKDMLIAKTFGSGGRSRGRGKKIAAAVARLCEDAPRNVLELLHLELAAKAGVAACMQAAAAMESRLGLISSQEYLAELKAWRELASINLSYLESARFLVTTVATTASTVEEEIEEEQAANRQLCEKILECSLGVCQMVNDWPAASFVMKHYEVLRYPEDHAIRVSTTNLSEFGTGVLVYAQTCSQTIASRIKNRVANK